VLSNFIDLEASDIAAGSLRSFHLYLLCFRRFQFRDSAKILGGLVYKLEKSGWVSNPTFSSGFLPLRGALIAGLLGKSTVEASGFLFSGEMMVVGHLVRPGRSAGKRYACAADVLLFVPFKTLKLFRREEGRLQRLVRPPVTRATGRSLQGPICNFLYLQGCLCKCWVVHYQKYM
jgi:hypothetical protein